MVTSGTLAWYGEVLELARTAEPETLLEEASLSQAMVAVEARAAHGAALLDMTDGWDLFVARTGLSTEEWQQLPTATGTA